MYIRRRTYGDYGSSIIFPLYCLESIRNPPRRPHSCREPVSAP